MRPKYYAASCADSDVPSFLAWWSICSVQVQGVYTIMRKPQQGLRMPACACAACQQAASAASPRLPRPRPRRSWLARWASRPVHHSSFLLVAWPSSSVHAHAMRAHASAVWRTVPPAPPPHRHAPSQLRHRQICSATLKRRHIQKTPHQVPGCGGPPLAAPGARPRAARLLEAALQAAVESVVQRREGRAGQHLRARPRLF